MEAREITVGDRLLLRDSYKIAVITKVSWIKYPSPYQDKVFYYYKGHDRRHSFFMPYLRFINYHFLLDKNGKIYEYKKRI